MPTITNKGQEYALRGDGTSDGSLARKAAFVHLYVSGSVPHKVAASATWTEATGGGYTAKPISVLDWTLSLDAGDQKIALPDQVWQITLTPMPNVLGAYLTDAAGNVLAWFERSTAITVIAGDQLTVSGIALKAA